MKFLEKNSVIVYRDALGHVLSRFIQVVNEYSNDVLIRFTCDCPVVMPELINRMADSFLSKKWIISPIP